MAIENKQNGCTVSREDPCKEFIGLDKQKIQREIVNIFLPISFNICFWCSKEPPH